MSAGIVALLIGLFIVPGIMLYLGHRLRRRSFRARKIFWGMFFGHTTGALLATWYSMIPPELWSSSDFWRRALGFYGMLLGGLVGALIGFLVSLFRHQGDDAARTQ
ncbi:MAG: hypothetical protein M3R07_06270 [Gemmatimonadota bacterium]|nr:hypothetical protein [Gemmatimonadota bacterium]